MTEEVDFNIASTENDPIIIVGHETRFVMWNHYIIRGVWYESGQATCCGRDVLSCG